MNQCNDIKLFRWQDRLALPSWYRWQRHLAIHGLLFASSVSIGILWTYSTKLQWSFINLTILFVLTFVWANIEYLIHRFVLHGSAPFLQKIAREHSYNHHRYFTSASMFATERVDLSRILLLPWHLLIVLVLNAALAGVLSLFSERFAILFYLAGILYIVSYEVVHGLSHFSQSSRLIFLQHLFSHHHEHHDLEKMRTFHFSIVFPILDSLWGTQIKKTHPKKLHSNASH